MALVSPPRRWLLRAVLGAAVVGVTALLVAVLGTGEESDGTDPHERDDRAAASPARGYTDEVTVPRSTPGRFTAAVPRPDELPPMIRATGRCEDALDAVRAFQAVHPSGLGLDADELEELTDLMRTVGPASGAACTDLVSSMFRAQELDPWLTWRPVGR